jgi:hypothetical protein
METKENDDLMNWLQGNSSQTWTVTHNLRWKEKEVFTTDGKKMKIYELQQMWISNTLAQKWEAVPFININDN